MRAGAPAPATRPPRIAGLDSGLGLLAPVPDPALSPKQRTRETACPLHRQRARDRGLIACPTAPRNPARPHPPVSWSLAHPPVLPSQLLSPSVVARLSRGLLESCTTTSASWQKSLSPTRPSTPSSSLSPAALSPAPSGCLAILPSGIFPPPPSPFLFSPFFFPSFFPLLHPLALRAALVSSEGLLVDLGNSSVRSATTHPKTLCAVHHPASSGRAITFAGPIPPVSPSAVLSRTRIPFLSSASARRRTEEPVKRRASRCSLSSQASSCDGS